MTLDAESVAGWVDKGTDRSRLLLTHLGGKAAPGDVVACQHDPGPLGAFMICWPDDSVQPNTIWHLENAAFFIRFLRHCYAPVLDAHRGLGALLAGRTRLEMAVTNDVLQVQLPGSWAHYSMIRHHALMLVHALIWLEEPARTAWGDLYRALLEQQMASSGGLPAASKLDDLERAAFDEFTTIGAQAVLATSDQERDAVATEATAGCRYQLLAAAAIAMLWEEYLRLEPQERVRWQERELAEGYWENDYLVERWESRRRAAA